MSAVSLDPICGTYEYELAEPRPVECTAASELQPHSCLASIKWIVPKSSATERERERENT